MGEAKRRRSASRDAALAAHVAKVGDAARAAERRLAERVRARGPGRKLVAAELLSFVEVLADPALGPGLLDALAASYAAAHGVGMGDVMCECAACRASWTPARTPRAVLVIRVLEPEAVRLALLCGACAGGTPEAVRGRVLAMLREEFLGGEAEEVTMAPEAGTA